MWHLGFLAAAGGWLAGKGRGWYWVILCPLAAAGAGGSPGLWCLAALVGWAAARDLREMEVPDVVWWLGGGAWVVFGGPVARETGIAGAYFALGFGLLLQYLARGMLGTDGYGDADVLCGVLAGLYLGPLGVCLSLTVGAAAGLVHGVWLRRRGVLGPGQPFPFLPALCVGVLAAAAFLQFSVAQVHGTGLSL